MDSCCCCCGLRITSEHAGLEGFEVSLEKQTVIVHPKTATYDEVLEKIKKTGKEVCMPFAPATQLPNYLWIGQVRSGKTVDADPLADKAAAPAPPVVEPSAV